MRLENYRPDVDGLRAIAVMAVVLYHAQLACPGGFAGVDIFFVISGYLITRILEKDLAAGRFSVTSFYQRRIRRIFPALFLMILVFAALGIRFLPPQELQDLSTAVVAASAFSSNILFFRTSGYFDNLSLAQPMLHTWTLSVEEQFYILWPWVLLGLNMRSLRRWRLPLVLAVIAGSVALSSYWVGRYPEAAFYLLPSRAFELAIGALLSIDPVPIALRRIPRPAAEIASITGLLMILAAVILYSSQVPFPGTAALLPCLGAALVIGAGEAGPTMVGRLLSVRPVVWIGLISYSLYLWHWPILVFARLFLYGQLTHLAGAVGAFLAILISWLSWRFVEIPFRNPRVIGGTSRMWVAGGLATSAVFVVAGLLLDGSGGLPGRSPEVARWVTEQSRRGNVELINSPCLAWGETLPPAKTCLLDDGTQKTGYSVVLWGDSFAAHLAPAFETIDRQFGIVTREMAKAGCSPVVGIQFLPPNRLTAGCPAFNENVIQNLLADQRVRVVVIAGRWNSLADGQTAAPANGAALSAPESRRLFVQGLRRTVSLLTSSGRQVVLVSHVPVPLLDPVTCLSRARFNGWDESGCDALPARFFSGEEVEIDNEIAEATRDLPGVRTVYPFSLLCDHQSCRFVDQGQPLYWDGHLAESGAKLLTPALADGVKDAVQAAGMQVELAKINSALNTQGIGNSDVRVEAAGAGKPPWCATNLLRVASLADRSCKPQGKARPL